MSHTAAVVLPVYDEEGNVGPLIAALAAIDCATSFSLRIIVVDDGSTDGTACELATIHRHVSDLEAVRHPQNQGSLKR